MLQPVRSSFNTCQLTYPSLAPDQSVDVRSTASLATLSIFPVAFSIGSFALQWTSFQLERA